MQYFILFASVLLILVEGQFRLGRRTCARRTSIVKLARHDCDCTSKNAGTLNYRDGKVLLCDGNDWSTFSSEGGYGSEGAPGKSCKDILENSQEPLDNGIYYISLAGVFLLGTVEQFPPAPLDSLL